MLWIKIGIVIIILSCIVILDMKRRRKKNKIKLMHETAYEILKEEALNHALERNYVQNDVYRIDKKKMLCLDAVDMKKEYVFSLEHGIRIGRDKENEICLKDETISKFHCNINISGEEVWITDLGSSNHTIIKRKGRKCVLQKGEKQRLNTKDILILGELRFKITLFYIDKKYLRSKEW